MNPNSLIFTESANSNDPAFYPFVLNHTYKVKKDFQKGGTQFVAGTQLVFKASGYGPYDDAIVYEFEKLDSKARIRWWLFRDEASTLWTDCFEEA